VVHRSFRSRIGEDDWGFLKLCVALVCRDAVPAVSEETGRWRRLDSTLSRVGAQARQAKDGNLALCVLADFADKALRRAALARARSLVAELPDRSSAR
jgi:hypothetical protein